MTDLQFRRLTRADLPALHRWLQEPGVVQWWEGEDVSWDAVVREYDPDDPTFEHWIASVDGRDVGWIQCYAAAAEPSESDAWWSHGVDRAAAGIDYLIGESADRGQGLGTAIIRAFVTDIVFGRHPSWPQAAASPYEANTASWRALERAGFRYVATLETDDDEGPCRLMLADRTEEPWRSRSCEAGYA